MRDRGKPHPDNETRWSESQVRQLVREELATMKQQTHAEAIALVLNPHARRN